MFNDLEDDVRGFDREARFKHTKQLVDRTNMMFRSQDELALFLAKGLFRMGLPLSEQGVIDGRSIDTINDLSDDAKTLKASNARTREQLRAGRRESSSGLKCFKCQGYGHGSFECRSGKDDRSNYFIQCFACKEYGHKSPDCPKKSDKPPIKMNPKQSDNVNKGLSLKAGKP